MRPPALLLLAALGGAGLSLGGPQPGRRNRCAHVVSRNVSCAALDGVGSSVQAQPRCPWGRASCPAALAYRVNFRPRYVTKFKTVTQLEWRCCPGFHGPDCQEGPRTPARPRSSVKEATDSEPSPVSQPRAPAAPTRATDLKQPAERRPGQQELQEQKIQALEQSVLRLTRTVLDLQSSLAGVSEDLKRAAQAQADAGKVPTAWPSSPAPASARDSETARPPAKGIKSELAEVRGSPKTKSDEELDGKGPGPEGPLRQLQEAARGPAATMTAAELLQAHVDARLEALRAELLEGMDRKLGDLKGTCQYRLAGLPHGCPEDGGEAEGSRPGLLELLAEKEAGLREELGRLRAPLQDPAARPGCCDGGPGAWGPQIRALERKVEGVAAALGALGGRLDRELELHRLATPPADADSEARWAELDARINATGRRAQELCVSVGEALRGALGGRDAAWRRLLGRELRALEQRLGGEAEAGTALPGPGLRAPACCAPFEGRWQALQARVRAELGACGAQAAAVEARLALVERTCGRLDAVAGGLRAVREGLGRQADALGACVRQLNGSLRAQAGDIAGLRSAVHQFYSHVFQVSSDLQGPVTLLPPAAPPTLKPPPAEAPTVSAQPGGGPALPGEAEWPRPPDQQPVPPKHPAEPGWMGPLRPSLPGSTGLMMETGEAGPPGGQGVSGKGLPQGEYGQTGHRPAPSAEGYAGAPGYPPGTTGSLPRTPGAGPGVLLSRAHPEAVLQRPGRHPVYQGAGERRGRLRPRHWRLHGPLRRPLPDLGHAHARARRLCGGRAVRGQRQRGAAAHGRLPARAPRAPPAWGPAHLRGPRRLPAGPAPQGGRRRGGGADRGPAGAHGPGRGLLHLQRGLPVPGPRPPLGTARPEAGSEIGACSPPVPAPGSPE